jgi:NAD(P)-dependent dehydrogenase (short-subunit alcohol dehydrogenase family)
VTPETQSKVVVITGASSGIGRATALLCARRGARLVLAARRQDALDEVATLCRACGGEAVAVALDVTEPGGLQSLAETAVERFGRIDAWINNAGIYAIGPFAEVPADVFDRVVAVNLSGAVAGSRAALGQFRRQGHGVLINVSSMIAGLAGPQATAYAASKWGLRGFTLALHEELRDAPRITACVVRPASFDTPIFRHAANYSGRALKALTPTYPTYDAAVAIAELIDHPRREVILGRSGKKVSAAHAVLPAVVDRIFAKRTMRDQFDDRPAAETPGNAFEPDPGWKSESGDWPVGTSHRAAVLVPLLAGLAATVAVRRRS